jgi:hypothetical protein
MTLARYHESELWGIRRTDRRLISAEMCHEGHRCKEQCRNYERTTISTNNRIYRTVKKKLQRTC